VGWANSGMEWDNSIEKTKEEISALKKDKDSLIIKKNYPRSHSFDKACYDRSYH
jgi:cell division GTPase FtsZ